MVCSRRFHSLNTIFQTPPKSPADSQWRVYKVNTDRKEEANDDINGERHLNQTITLKNACDAKLNVSVRIPEFLVS